MVANFETFSNMTTWDELTEPSIAAAQFQQYVADRTGLYSAFSSSVAFIPWSAFLEPADIVSIKAALDGELASDPQLQKPVFRLQRQWIDDDTVPQLEVILFARTCGPSFRSWWSLTTHDAQRAPIPEQASPRWGRSFSRYQLCSSIPGRAEA